MIEDFRQKAKKKKSDFFNIVTWRSNAEFVCRYFAKGRMILVEGELQTRSYVDKNGQNVRVVELVADQVCFTGEPKQQQGAYSDSYSAPPPPEPPQQVGSSQPSASDFSSADSDDDYPF